MKIKVILILFAAILLSGFLSYDNSLNNFATQNTEKVAATYVKNVEQANLLFSKLNYKPENKETFIKDLLAVRKAIKFTESITGFFDIYALNKIFAPNIFKVEYESGEPASVIDPIGFQRIEEMLDENASKQDIDIELRKLNYVFRDYVNYARTLHFDESLFFLALKAELIRIQTQGITGFDNPVYSNCLEESAIALEGMNTYLTPFFDANPTESVALKKALQDAISYLKQNQKKFDTFNRLLFIKQYINTLHSSLLAYQKQLNIPNVSSEKENLFAINQDATNIFDKDFLNPFFFHKSRKAYPDEKINELGKILFFDPVLSINNKRACASCHKPEKAFAESIKTSIKFDFEGNITRNAPTLVNSAFQNKFQLEGRAENPERQMHLVIFSEDEMGNNQANLINTLNASAEYVSLFQEAFGTTGEVNFSMVKYALGGYIRSLIALNSPFDRYMRNEITSISPSVENGFNLFMGKAACATCHFAPIFNGTVPPQFSETEIEVLGVTVSNDFKNPILDKDLGAYINGQSEYHRFGFKTPTVRNVEYTAPYMHNGAFGDLQTVMEFYKKGGGAGLGLDIPYQTLPFDNLKLSKKEIQDIILFMEALSDTSGITSKPFQLPYLGDEKLNRRTVGGEY